MGNSDLVDGHEVIGKHLEVIEMQPPGTTKKWEVWNITKNELLGYIKWDGAWRRYVFDDGACKYDAECHLALGNFLKEEMEKWKRTK